MQLQADTSGRRVERALARDLSALGVAHLAGRSAGLWSQDQLDSLDRARESFEPVEATESRQRRRGAWHDAVGRARREDAAMPGPNAGARAGGTETDIATRDVVR
jgi:glycerol kinase